ncbi:MAG: L-aspartate oxidase [Gemmatimonadetes bacterium]|nr:L-aspartate oxidase [Gemmatimonadota bacterium]
MRTVSTDVVVIGSGMAGLTFALQASEIGSVTVITKKRRADSSTNWAQGGIAAAIDPADSPALHARDTLIAGAGLCHRSAVRQLVAEGPARVRDLLEWGVAFTRSTEGLSLGLEGGHSRRRILHAGDLTGQEIERALLHALGARSNVTLLEDHIAVDLLIATTRAGRRRCRGVLALDHIHGEWNRFECGAVFLATGGLGEAYAHTTNPDIATGDGLAMAYRAGVVVANLEFVQFHPTALAPAHDRAFLISEAVRGEGAVLRRPSGEPLMSGLHPQESLAPRDIVARAIDLVMKETGAPHVWLDVSTIPAATFQGRFPAIAAECARRGLVLPRDPIPVVPAAHYACGGVLTDLWARTSLAGLFAAGEVACTGVHGANRLASNSLLEAVVYSHRAARKLPNALASAETDLQPDAAGRAGPADPVQGGESGKKELRELMWNDVGIVRTGSRLEAAATRLAAMRAASPAPGPSSDLAAIEHTNLIDVATLITTCALSRTESRGLHYRLDYPSKNNERFLHDTVLGGVLPRERPGEWDSSE